MAKVHDCKFMETDFPGEMIWLEKERKGFGREIKEKKRDKLRGECGGEDPPLIVVMMSKSTKATATQ